MHEPHYLRLYSPDEPADTPAHVLATRELLRPATHKTTRHLEPYTRSWYENLEVKRYHRHCAWLPRWLEFSRHHGESLLALGPGLGCDAIQYDRHGTKVTIVAGPEDPAAKLREHLSFRGLDLPVLDVERPSKLPLARNSFDLACWNALYSRADLGETLAEIYRVLKPGGKLFALFPAKFDCSRWQRWLMPLRKYYRDCNSRPTSGPKRTGRELHKALAKFSERRIVKRLLRRSELPHLWRPLPLGLLERMMGRVLAVRAFKPVSAATECYADAA